jgi:tetratricopeptide (TPR) repeat protein
MRVDERFDEAETALRRALEIDPNHEGARLDLASIFLRGKKPEEAERVLKPLMEQQPSAVAQGLMGMALAVQKKTEEALPYLQQAFGRDPQQPDVARQLGQVLLALKRTGEAVRAFEAAHRLQQSPDSLFLLARAQRLAGDPARALENLKALVKASPSHLMAQRELAACLEDLGAKEQALQLYQAIAPALAKVEGGDALLQDVQARISALSEHEAADAKPKKGGK